MLSTVLLAYHNGGKITTAKRDFPEDLRFVQLPAVVQPFVAASPSFVLYGVRGMPRAYPFSKE